MNDDEKKAIEGISGEGAAALGTEGNAGDEDAPPAITFSDLGLDEITQKAIDRKGFLTPSPIQVLAIPRLLGGDANVIARARTGTGKTAAFGLPLTQCLREKSGHVMAIILEPTRELAIQTAEEMQSFTQGRYPRTCVVYGGSSYSTQIRELRQGVEIVVGTPGRVQDHLKRGVLDISKIDYFILDEGDEMLDMGFIDDIENIFKEANPSCRVLLFSATMPQAILKIAERFMGEYEVVEEGGIVDEPLLIEQHYWVVREREKINALARLIDSAEDFYGLVFTQTKMDADNVCKALDDRGFDAAALHGDVPQGQREKILARFRNKRTRVLVATDVAARGIDITGLSHVVNYSLPFDGATYVHRIGRTGRAGAAGKAITFVRPEERRRLRFIEAAIKKSSKGDWSYQDVPSIEDVLKEKTQRLFKEIQKGIEDGEGSKDIAQYQDMAKKLTEGGEALDILARLIKAVYGSALDKGKYGEISRVNAQMPNRGERRQMPYRRYKDGGGYRGDREEGRIRSAGHLGRGQEQYSRDNRGRDRGRDGAIEKKEERYRGERGGKYRKGGSEGENRGGFGSNRASKFLHGGYNIKDEERGKRKERPNVHTPTERNASRGLYRQKKNKERF